MLVFDYWAWHYRRGVKDVMILARNYSWFILHFFSIPLLILTLFSPWKRLSEERTARFDIGDALGVFLVNIMMRLFGFCFRITVIAVGLAALILSACFWVICIAIWILFPLAILLLFSGGVTLIIGAL
jgi:hypothetical protein